MSLVATLLGNSGRPFRIFLRLATRCFDLNIKAACILIRYAFVTSSRPGYYVRPTKTWPIRLIRGRSGLFFYTVQMMGLMVGEEN